MYGVLFEAEVFRIILVCCEGNEDNKTRLILVSSVSEMLQDSISMFRALQRKTQRSFFSFGLGMIPFDTIKTQFMLTVTNQPCLNCRITIVIWLAVSEIVFESE